MTTAPKLIREQLLALAERAKVLSSKLSHVNGNLALAYAIEAKEIEDELRSLAAEPVGGLLEVGGKQYLYDKAKDAYTRNLDKKPDSAEGEQPKVDGGPKAQLIAKLSDALTNNLYNGGLSWQDVADARDYLSAAPQPDLGAMAEQASAWDAVCMALNNAVPGWHSLSKRGMDSAVLAIQGLAKTQPEQPARDGAEPVIRIYAEGSYCVVTEWMDGAKDLPNGDHLLYAQPPQQPARDGVSDVVIGAAFLAVLRDPKIAWRETEAQPFIDRVSAEAARLASNQPPQQADGGAVDQSLRDPSTVHALMLRGVIAKPSWRQVVDLMGEVPNGEEQQLARIAELQYQLAANQPKSPGVGVDEAMVERACIAWMEDAIDDWESISNTSRNAIRNGMRRSLLAAHGGEK